MHLWLYSCRIYLRWSAPVIPTWNLVPPTCPWYPQKNRNPEKYTGLVEMTVRRSWNGDGSRSPDRSVDGCTAFDGMHFMFDAFETMNNWSPVGSDPNHIPDSVIRNTIRIGGSGMWSPPHRAIGLFCPVRGMRSTRYALLVLTRFLSFTTDVQ